MNIVDLLREAINRLPEGDYSLGLNAVARHISIAIKHFERDDRFESDSLTDAVYRTNQAFEGSLKEAYRVLAGKDPSKKTINEIESYLEHNNVIRPRVLTQLTRYRHDYRNPSTHDYKLDFDEDEAILAIVSVCAFSKLLVNQIEQKLAFDAAARLIAASPGQDQTEPGSGPQLDLFLKTSFAALTIEDAHGESFYHQVDSVLSGALHAAGFHVHHERPIEYLEGHVWDLFVQSESFSCAIETRREPRHDALDTSRAFSIVSNGARQEKTTAGLVVYIGDEVSKRRLYEFLIDGTPIYVVSSRDLKAIATLSSEPFKIIA